MEDVEQIDLFGGADLGAPETPAKEPLNGMYYERATDMFVSFVRGSRYYEEPAVGCPHPKEWQEKTKRERAI